MLNTLKYLYILALLYSVCALTSCKKDNVSPPAPPRSVTPESDTVVSIGNATVYYVTISKADWKNLQEVKINTPALTQNVVNHGNVEAAILVGNEWRKLPWTVDISLIKEDSYSDSNSSWYSINAFYYNLFYNVGYVKIVTPYRKDIDDQFRNFKVKIIITG